MTRVIRLVTVVDLDDRVIPADVRDAPTIDGPAPPGFAPAAIPLTRGEPDDDPRTMSFSSLHVAHLDDGRRVTLLDDRGWSESGPDDLWHRTTVEEIVDTARTVVGPDEADEADEDHTPADMAADHWTNLAATLRGHGMRVSGQDLSRLPHDVELSQRVKDRLARP